STAGIAGSENMSAQVSTAPEPKVDPLPDGENRCDTCAASHPSTLLGEPGACHQAALSTRSGEPGTCAGCLSPPPPAAGAPASWRAPGGTANEARMASASATARCSGES